MDQRKAHLGDLTPCKNQRRNATLGLPCGVANLTVDKAKPADAGYCNCIVVTQCLSDPQGSHSGDLTPRKKGKKVIARAFSLLLLPVYAGMAEAN